MLAKATPEERAEIDRILAAPPDIAYRHDPVGWMRDVLGIPEWSLRWSMLPEYRDHVWDGTPDPLAAMCEGIAAGQDVGVESATGTGKTYVAGALSLWFCACWMDSLTITTAPVEKQLKAQLWKEIGAHWAKFAARYPMASTVDLRVRMRALEGERERWAILGYGCGVDADAASATRAQGFHAAHMLIITEETPGIDGAVMTAHQNTSTGDHNLRLALGNPDHQLDQLHIFCQRPGVRHIIISALDHPNVVCGREVIPGAVGRKSIAARLAECGGIAETPIYQSRVRGISPAEASDSLIKLQWCQASAERWKARTVQPDDLPAYGVDVAQSEAGDMAAVARGRGNLLQSVTEKPCNNATVLGRELAGECKAHGVLPSHVGVDSIGVGAATVNELREKLGGIQALNSGASPLDGAQKAEDGAKRPWLPDANRFRNLRGQMWWQMREDLRTGAVDLPNDPELFRQLIMPKYQERLGIVVLEEKAETKKRLGRSPDKADAVVYWNWVRPRKVVAEEGQSVPVKQDDRRVTWDYKNRRPVERTAEQAFAEMGGFGGGQVERVQVVRPEGPPKW